MKTSYLTVTGRRSRAVPECRSVDTSWTTSPSTLLVVQAVAIQNLKKNIFSVRYSQWKTCALRQYCINTLQAPTCRHLLLQHTTVPIQSSKSLFHIPESLRSRAIEWLPLSQSASLLQVLVYGIALYRVRDSRHSVSAIGFDFDAHLYCNGYKVARFARRHLPRAAVVPLQLCIFCCGVTTNWRYE